MAAGAAYTFLRMPVIAGMIPLVPYFVNLRQKSTCDPKLLADLRLPLRIARLGASCV